MSKTRTILRYCLVALLLSCAVVTVYLWPYRPVLMVKRDLQKSEMESIVHLDEAKQLLVTHFLKFEKGGPNKLLGYDTNTGECSWESENKLNVGQFHPVSTRSANGQWTLKFNHSSDTLDVYDNASQQIIKKLPAPELPAHPHQQAAGFDSSDKYVWVRIGNTVRVYETSTFSSPIDLSINPNWIIAQPDVIYLNKPYDLDVSENGKYLIVADRNRNSVGLIDLKSKREFELQQANVALFLPDNRTIFTVKISPHGHLESAPHSYRMNENHQLEILPMPGFHKYQGNFVTMNRRFLVTYQPPKGISQLPAIGKWIPQKYHAKLIDMLGLLQFNVAFTVWSTETGQKLHQFTLSLPGTMEPNGSLSFNRVNPHADVISSDGTLLGLSDTASLSLWNIPPRRHRSCWAVAGGFVLLALWCGWRRKVLAAKSQG